MRSKVIAQQRIPELGPILYVRIESAWEAREADEEVH